MTHALALLTVLLLAPLAALDAADAPISHRVLLTDYKGNRVVILSAKGDIEWEFPAKTPQDCWLLPNGNVLFSQITGAAEVTMDKKMVWEYQAPAKALVHSCQLAMCWWPSASPGGSWSWGAMARWLRRCW
jgi:hypothetical protein